MEHTISTTQSINGNINHKSLTEEYNELCEMYTFIHKYIDVYQKGSSENMKTKVEQLKELS